MQKKAQGISINTIIIAAIGLAVLVVLFLIFTGRLGIFSKVVADTTSCQNGCAGLGKSWTETDRPGCTSSQGQVLPGTYADITTEGNVCCCI